MKKSKFLITTFKNLDRDVKALIEKFGKNPNGNAVNSLVRKYENLAYDTDFWWNGEFSVHTKDKNGKWLKIQENKVDFRTIILSRIKAL